MIHLKLNTETTKGYVVNDPNRARSDPLLIIDDGFWGGPVPGGSGVEVVPIIGGAGVMQTLQGFISSPGQTIPGKEIGGHCCPSTVQTLLEENKLRL